MPRFELDTPGEATLVADAIRAYLEQADKRTEPTVLGETTQRFRQVIVRALMQPRDTRAGKESCTLYAGPCARKARLTLDGAAREPIRARTVLKFLLGDLVELSVLALARLAGCEITDNNLDLTIQTHGVAVPVHPDGFHVAANGQGYNVEIKSCDSRTFDAWLANGGPTDDWGYLTQASVEVQAWREYGRPVEATLFIAVSTGSRQGSIAEWIVPYNEALVNGWHARRRAARALAVPDVPFLSEPETQFMRGKNANAEWFLYGEPVPRKNEKGAIHGWDIQTGRAKLPTICSYCDFRAHCWPQAVMELDGTKPVWIIPPDRPDRPNPLA